MLFRSSVFATTSPSAGCWGTGGHGCFFGCEVSCGKNCLPVVLRLASDSGDLGFISRHYQRGMTFRVRQDFFLALLLRVLAPATHSEDRKSTRLNSSHQIISYAVFC